MTGADVRVLDFAIRHMSEDAAVLWDAIQDHSKVSGEIEYAPAHKWFVWDAMISWKMRVHDLPESLKPIVRIAEAWVREPTDHLAIAYNQLWLSIDHSNTYQMHLRDLMDDIAFLLPTWDGPHRLKHVAYAALDSYLPEDVVLTVSNEKRHPEYLQAETRCKFYAQFHDILPCPPPVFDLGPEIA